MGARRACVTIERMKLSGPLAGVLLLAFGLAGCAAYIDARATSREMAWRDAHPPQGRLLPVNGLNVHVLERGRPRGAAPSLVLLHGASGNLNDFTFDLIERLEPDYHILALDRPGLGWSDSLGSADSDPRAQARQLRAAVRQLGVRNPVVLGHSYGGAVAMSWALNAPEDTAALVLLAAPTYPWEGKLGAWYRLNASPLGRPTRNLVASLAPEHLVSGVIAGIFEPQPVPEGYDMHIGAGLSLQRSVLEANTRQVNALNGYLRQMQPLYGTLTLPIEQVHGDLDTTVGLELHSRRLAADLPNAALQVLEGVGHMPHHANPDAVVAAIARAVARAGLSR